MTLPPLVDVVIPTRNSEKFIGRSVGSVLGQSYSSFRLFVVDDGSADGTIDALATIDDGRLSVLSQPATGVSAARNRGASAGTSEYVAFLDSDDEADERWLERMLFCGAGADVVGCGGRMVQPIGGSTTTSLQRPSDGGAPPEPVFLAGLFMVRRTLFDSIGGYDESMARSENTDLGFRLMDAVEERGLAVATTDEVLVTLYRAVQQSAKYSASTRQNAAEAMIRKHGERFARDRATASSYYAIAGLSALRNRDKPAARRHLRSAVRLKPARWRYWARLLQAELPPRNSS